MPGNRLISGFGTEGLPPMSIRDRHVVETLEPRGLLAATPVPVGDINQTTDHVGPDHVTPVGAISFFAGRPTDADGPELFKTDGTTAGTVLVRDIDPIGASAPDLLTNVNGTLYFVADDGVHGRELWKSDGTTSGTTMVADLNPNNSDSTPTNLTNVNGTLYFVANDGSGTTTLYVTDGTAAGTTKVHFGGSSSVLYSPTGLAAYNGRLLLTVNSGGIYSVTGTIATTVSTTPNYATNLTAFNGAVYFTIGSSAFGTQRGDLWKTDGTAAGTTSVASIDYLYSSGSTDYATVRGMTVSGDRLYFYAGSVITGSYSVWTSDGTTSGTRSLYSSSSVDPSRTMTAVGTRSVIFDIVGGSGSSMWVSDSTPAGTKILKSFSSGTYASGRVGLGNGRLLFVTQSGNGGVAQIYTTDGTAAGTVNAATVSSAPSLFYPVGTVNGKAVLTATRRLTDGEIYVSDGTTAGAARIGATLPANGSSLDDYQAAPVNKQFFAVGNTVYFSATDGNSGFELYKSVNRGTPVRVADLNPGAGDSGADDFVAAPDGGIFFTTGHLSDGTKQLMRMNANGAISQIASSTYSFTDITPAAEQVYFKVNGILWRWAAGDTAAAVTVGGQTFGSASRFVRAGDAWYFGARPTTGTTVTSVQRLFRIDNTTTARPVAVVDVPSGDGSAYVPEPIAAIGNTLLFTAYTAANGTELWKTDGTAAGTALVGDLSPGTASTSFDTFSPNAIFAADGVVYFSAGDGKQYDDLFRTDGTATGTTKLAAAIDPRQFVRTAVGIYFVGYIGTATGNAAQSAVYRIDGNAVTAVTTPGSGDAAFSPNVLLAAGNNVFSIGLGGDRARFELWRADAAFNGFAKVTLLADRVYDAWGGTLNGFFGVGRNAIAATDTDLYFPLYADATGIEPYRLPLATTGSVSGVVYDDANADGARNSGEGLTAGDVVYVDLNNNATPDAAEPKTVATAAGYTITGVPEGTYSVRRAPTTDGRRQTSPYANGPTGATAIVVAGQTTVGLDFGTTARPPTVAGASYSVDEGRTVPLHGVASEAFGTIVKYEWDFDYNAATFDADAAGQDVTFDATAIDGHSVRIIALRATDANGLTAIQTSDVTVNNVRPTATFVTDGPVTAGDAATFRFIDPVDVAADLPGLRYSFDFNNNGSFTDAGDVSLAASAVASRVFTTAGTYTVRGRVTDKDGGQTDYTTSIVVNAGDPQTATLEGEAAAFAGGTAASNGNAGYTGTGYADFAGINSSAQWTLSRVAGGAVTLGFRYANGGTADRPLTVLVNGASVGTLSMPTTGSWTTWQTVTIAANLVAGANTIKAVAAASIGGANVDSVVVTRAAPAWLSAGVGAAYTLSGNTLTVTAGVVTLLADVAGTNGGLNVVVSGSAKIVTAATQHLGSLNLNGTASLSLTGARGQRLRVTALSVAASATLDLNESDLILDYAAGAVSPAAAVRGLIASARNTGGWTGVGLTSSAAKSNTARTTALGYLTAAEYKSVYGTTASFAGESIDDTAVLVRYTLNGDTDFDRGVSINDFNRLSGAFGSTNASWLSGDADYDAGVSINDFNALAGNFGKIF